MAVDLSWELFKQAARQEPHQKAPLAPIVDSPWLPGYVGIDTRDSLGVSND